jgi:hypothetical protein
MLLQPATLHEQIAGIDRLKGRQGPDLGSDRGRLIVMSLSRCTSQELAKGQRFGVALVFFFLAIVAAAPVQAGLAVHDEVSRAALVTGSVRPLSVRHELRIALTRQGTESIELAARLSQDGGIITLPIAWSIRRGGETIFRDNSPVVDRVIEPGDYVVEAAYGTVRVAQSVTVLAGQSIGLTLILNVGGMRALAMVKDIPPIQGIASRYDIYDEESGRLVSRSQEAGEVIRLRSGKYLVESRLLPGNTLARSTVAVKAGVLSSLEIKHEAGVAAVDVADRLSWTIRDLSTGWSASGEGRQDAVVLAPGIYEFESGRPGQQRLVSFTITAGERRVLTNSD